MRTIFGRCMKAPKEQTQRPAERDAKYFAQSAMVAPRLIAVWEIPSCAHPCAPTGEFELTQTRVCPENGRRRYQTE